MQRLDHPRNPQVAFRALKWQRILRSDGVRMRFDFLIKTYMIGGFISLFLPTSFGGDVYRVAAARGVNQDLAKSASSVLFDRLTGFFALVSICMVGFVALPDHPYAPLVVTFYALGVADFLVTSADRAITMVDASSVLVRRGAKILRSFRNYRTDRRALVLLVSFAFQFNVVVINLYARSWHRCTVPPSAGDHPTVYLTEALPISINGMGVRESAFAFFFVMNGLTVEQGVAVSLLIVAERYLSGLLGGSFLLAGVIASKVAPAGAPADSP